MFSKDGNRKLLFFLMILSLTTHTSGQKPTTNQRQQLDRCGTMEYYDQLFKLKPSFKKLFEERQRQLSIASQGLPIEKTTLINDTIPVVIHVIGSASLQAQVTDAILQSQIDVLNEDYNARNVDSSRIPAAFKPLVGKIGLTFLLAQTDPDGNLTNGIERRTNAITFTREESDNAKRYSLGGLNAWNPNSYVNLWVVNFSDMILGISVFPGDPRPLSLHGIVCDYRAFGRGAAHLYANYNKGRTTTHELGHFLNLRHIWADDNGACGNTDFPGAPAGQDDTPDQASETTGNPDASGTGTVITDACSNRSPGIMYQNYMDYTNDIALVMFTKGQNSRMESALANSSDRKQLLNSTTYLPPTIYALDAGMLGILNPADQSYHCATAITPVIKIKNQGSTTLTSIVVNIKLNDGEVVSTPYTVNLHYHDETDLTLSTITATNGANKITIYTSLPNGLADEQARNDTLHSSFIALLIPVSLPLTEGFESAAFPPSPFSIYNPGNDFTWQRKTPGKTSTAAAFIDNYNNAYFGSIDDIRSPLINATATDSLIVSFDLAHKNIPDADYHDTLSVLLSADCGVTFTTVYKKWGAQLSTAGTSEDDYQNAAQGDWRTERIAIYAASLTPGQFIFVFRNTNRYGNNIFLDNIKIEAKLPQRLKDQGYLILPNPFHDQLKVWHLDEPTNLQRICLYNTLGQLVWSKEFHANAKKIETADLGKLQRGIYFVELRYTNKKAVAQQVIKL